MPGLLPAITLAAGLQTIVSNGPSANRVNLVFLSEGYTSSQSGLFLVDATNRLNSLFATPPYQEYQRYFNGFAIFTASAQSGSDHPAYLQARDTYFNSTFDDVGDFLVTIPPDWADANYSHGQGKVDALLQSFMPDCDLAIMLVNDPVRGGSGAPGLAIASTGSDASLVIHEAGHSLSGLGDEYTLDDLASGFPTTEEPNTTQQTNRALIKWNAWITPSTPVPTPQTAPYVNAVGLFQGAHYNSTGWYRPKLNCMMGSYGGIPFCEVCREASVLSFYQRVRPVDSITPAATNFWVSSPSAVSFGLNLLQPTSHNLSLQWAVDGVPQASSTNSSFVVLPQSLANGTHVVAAQVVDGTAYVRTDPTNLLRQTVTWTLNVNLPQLRLDSPRWLAGGGFTFRVTGNAPAGFVIQGSTNLFAWVPLSTNVLSGGQFNYTNSDASSHRIRAFRALSPPP